MIAARRPPAPEPVKKFVRPSAIGRLARSAALLLILRQSASRGAAGVSSPRFSWRGFLGAAFFSRYRSEPNPACPHGRDEDGHTAASSTLAGSLFKTGASQRATSAMLVPRA